MYSDDFINDQHEKLWAECRILLAELISEAPVKTTSLKIPARKILDFENNEFFYILKDGVLKEFYNNTQLVNYGEGDLIGLQSLIDRPQTQIETDFAIVVDEYDVDEFLFYVMSDRVRSKKWHAYLSNIIQVLQLIIGSYKKKEVLFQPVVREFKKGEHIIEQGDQGNEVYTLVNGSASVILNGTQVGEIQRDEIFGAIAALTQTVRTANVVATSDCLIMVVPSDHFQSLLTSRPEMVTKLIEDMARNIISSNEKILALSSQGA
ncbi:MAG: cyclic nucleotide-binding domain-containing protein [Gammaproteobacteria bacterium]|nr:cyclic nucleotide-binding domain-containing protein [Gammaproteobacteria bacterium]